MINDITKSKFQGSDKNYSQFSAEDKVEYSKFIQVKYINDLDEYIQALNDGRMKFAERQAKEWVEGLRIFSDIALKAGWKTLIQGLRPNYIPPISEAKAIFNNINIETNRNSHNKIKKEEKSFSPTDRSDASRILRICMSYSQLGEEKFHQKCIEFFEDMAGREKDRTLKIKFKDAVQTHRRLLNKYKSSNTADKSPI